MKKQNNSLDGRRAVYSSPRIEVLEISVEKGFVESQSDYGDPGAAGDYLEDGNEYDL